MKEQLQLDSADCKFLMGLLKNMERMKQENRREAYKAYRVLLKFIRETDAEGFRYLYEVIKDRLLELEKIESS